MISVVRLSKAHLNLHYRAEHDRRKLAHFLDRDEQREALDRLLDSSAELGSSNWATHFIGIGGVGKTMLMRCLTGPYAQARGGLRTTRIDFDHVDPRYPTERPGRLLEELASGLAIYIENRTQEHFYDTLQSAIERANTVAKSVSPAGDALDSLHTRQFTEALAAFVGFAETLQPPIVLVLDTCEELAKLHPAGENVPSVDATFEILEHIQKSQPSLRVVFAGRRHLTAMAANLALIGTASTPPSVMSLKERSYLTVEEIRGFTRDEVSRYLTGIRGLSPDAELLEAVLRFSREPGRAKQMGPLEGERFGPFEIERYADWIASEPDLRADQLATSDADPVDPYVRVRIVGRMNDPDVLPFAVVLGRFDAALLHAALPGDEALRRKTVMALAEHEWINLEGDPEISNMVFTVQPGLLPRLRSYCRQTGEGHLLESARERLGALLTDALLRDPPAELSAEQVEGAVRVLPPEEAAVICDRLAERVADAEAWP